MNHAQRLCLGAWLAVLVAAAGIVTHARYSADLSAFLPRSPTRMQQLLVQQLQDGLASRLILIGIEGADAARRARASQELAAALRGSDSFLSISNGESATAQRDRDFVFEHRYVLSPAVDVERFSAAGLRAALLDGLQGLAAGAGLAAASLFSVDPTAETLQVMDQFDALSPPRHSGGVWSSRDGQRALLLAQTRASGSDTQAQARALQEIRAAWQQRAAALAPLHLQLSGPGVFAVEARDRIEQQALRLSLLSTAMISALLLLVYRSLPTLLLGLLPVLTGALVGVAAVAVGFGIVHGITLGFGVTLIGESVDYSIYLFIQTRRGEHSDAAALHRLWPTLALGMATSICGFASLLPSAFPGLAQLGLFSISGLLAAAAVTRFVLPALLPKNLALADLSVLGARAAQLLARARLPAAACVVFALACMAVLYQHRTRLWNRDLAALSPVSLQAQALDAQMRADLGAPDVSNLVIVSGSSQEAVLRLAELVGMRLDGLVAQNGIAGYDSPARYLPSRALQQQRRDSLPPSRELRARLAAAGSGVGLQSGALAPFMAAIAAAREAPLLTRADLNGTSFALAVDALLWQRDAEWYALLPLHAPQADIDIAQVRGALAAFPASRVVVLNIRQQTEALYGSYLSEALHLCLTGLAAIVLLLWVVLRRTGRVLRVMAPLLLAVLGISAGFALAGIRLTILHLIGLLLIVAVGSNYALFFQRPDPDRGHTAMPLTLASVLTANACTVIGFGVLAFSSVPVLSALGQTVAPGTVLALLFAALLCPPGLLAAAAR